MPSSSALDPTPKPACRGPQALPGLNVPLPVPPGARHIAEVIAAAGGRPLIVGGAVRDHLLGIAPKDVDFEVYGLELDALSAALETQFSVHAVGRSFGVLKVSTAGETVDVALPRTESKSGQGHRGFIVAPDPFMPFEKAAARRDFTINAMAYDLDDDTLMDAHGGTDDLRAGVLRHTSPAFAEDPLRVFRAAGQRARFALDVHPDTVALCRQLFPELQTIARERLFTEFEKLLTRAPYPSLGLWTLRDTGALALFPELQALIGTPQEPEWHPEGDVWIHTLLVTDEAARLCRREGFDAARTFRIVLGALCHDLGKPGTTERTDGRIRSKNHESAGDPPTRSFCERIGVPPKVVDEVVALVREHLKPFQLFADRANVGDGALRRLALRVDVGDLIWVAQADHFGRTTRDALLAEDEAGPWLKGELSRLSALDARPTPILLGRHLMSLGHKPGPAFGPLLKAAFEAQLDGAFDDEAGAVAWASAQIDGGAF